MPTGTAATDDGDADSGGGVSGGRPAVLLAAVADRGLAAAGMVVVVMAVVVVESAGEEPADESEERGVADAELLVRHGVTELGERVGVMSGVEAGVMDDDDDAGVVAGDAVVMVSGVGAGHSDIVAAVGLDWELLELCDLLPLLLLLRPDEEW